MSDARRSSAPRPRPGRRRGAALGLAAGARVVAVALVAPFYLDVFWLQVGVFAFAAMVAALGLELLVGEAGQLSLAHSFFIAVGAYGYTLFAADPSRRRRPTTWWAGACRRSSPWCSRSSPPGWPGCCSARSPPGCAASTSAWPRSGWCSSASTCWSTPSRSPAASTAATSRRSRCSGSASTTCPARPCTCSACPSPGSEKLWYVGLAAAVARLAVLPQPARQPGRAGAARGPRRRGRRRR